MTHEEELNKAAELWIAGVFLAYSAPDTIVKELREIAEKSFIAGAEWHDRQLNWARDLVQAGIDRPEEALNILKRLKELL